MVGRSSQSATTREPRDRRPPVRRLLHGRQGAGGWVAPVVAAAAAAALVGGWLPVSVAPGAGVLAAAFVLALTAALRGAGLYVGVAVGLVPMAVGVGLRAGGLAVPPELLVTVAAAGFSGGVAGFAVGYGTLVGVTVIAGRS